MITPNWICPACGDRNTYKDNSDAEIMNCKCPKCSCEFTVNVRTTEAE